jgi:hypothetical protein
MLGVRVVALMLIISAQPLPSTEVMVAHTISSSDEMVTKTIQERENMKPHEGKHETLQNGVQVFDWWHTSCTPVALLAVTNTVQANNIFHTMAQVSRDNHISV